MRKEETGDWMNHLTETQVEMMMSWERKKQCLNITARQTILSF